MEDKIRQILYKLGYVCMQVKKIQCGRFRAVKVGDEITLPGREMRP